MRGIDHAAIHEFGLPGVVLMENAGRGAADVLVRLGVAGEVVILAGKGNNGGDGFVMARHLQLMGIEPGIVLIADRDRVSGDARVNLNVATASQLDVVPFISEEDLASRLGRADWVIDCLLGTGARGAPRGRIGSAIRLVNETAARVVAIDVPSGLDCDTGTCDGDCILADDTITFVSEKVGLLCDGAARHVGRIHVVGIGVPRLLLDRFTN